MNRGDREALARRCIRLAEMLVGDPRTAAWPSKVEKGGLRKKMGLKADEPLEDQASASDVVKFFNGTDAEGRGMVMFAVNSNKGSSFWKKVGAALAKQSKEGSARVADDEAAYRMLTGRRGQMVVDVMTGMAGLVGDDFERYRDDVGELERIAGGRGVAEASRLVRALHSRVKKLKGHVDKMEAALAKAAR